MRRISVVDYDPCWPPQFFDEARRVLSVLAPYVLAIEHIGSTSVPGLAAKPIIDILVGVRQLRHDAPCCIEALTALGYEYAPAFEDVMPYRRFFRRDDEAGQRSHHLHLVEREHPFFVEHVAFRDYLRCHPADVLRYGQLKQRLAKRFPADPAGYFDAKAPFVAELRDRALAWADHLLTTTVAWAGSADR